jgi:hypothetical protein
MRHGGGGAYLRIDSAAVPFETSSLKLWRSLAREDRLEAARAFWERPPQEAGVAAAQEIVKILRVRPQAFHKIPIGQRVSALAGLAHPPENLADALLVALHVGARRPLLVDFLDRLAIPHEEGLISDEAELPEITEAAAREALAALELRHPARSIRVYWNALWLQDPVRWRALETASPAGA